MSKIDYAGGLFIAVIGGVVALVYIAIKRPSISSGSTPESRALIKEHIEAQTGGLVQSTTDVIDAIKKESQESKVGIVKVLEETVKAGYKPSYIPSYTKLSVSQQRILNTHLQAQFSGIKSPSGEVRAVMQMLTMEEKIGYANALYFEAKLGQEVRGER